MAAQTAASSAQAAQTGLVAAFDADLASALAAVDLRSLDSSRLFAVLAALVHKYGQASATLAARFYQRQRRAAGLPSIHVQPAPLPDLSQINATVGWAITPLRQNGDLATTETNLSGSLGRLVQDVGRRTLVDTVRSDRKARGWARVTRPGACSFCRLLATRGAVYKSEETAGGGDFRFHDDCHCYVEPVFGFYEMTARARADLELYKTSTRGLSNADARNAFRRAVEASKS